MMIAVTAMITREKSADFIKYALRAFAAFHSYTITLSPFEGLKKAFSLAGPVSIFGAYKNLRGEDFGRKADQETEWRGGDLS